MKFSPGGITIEFPRETRQFERFSKADFHEEKQPDQAKDATETGDDDEDTDVGKDDEDDDGDDEEDVSGEEDDDEDDVDSEDEPEASGDGGSGDDDDDEDEDENDDEYGEEEEEEEEDDEESPQPPADKEEIRVKNWSPFLLFVISVALSFCYVGLQWPELSRSVENYIAGGFCHFVLAE